MLKRLKLENFKSWRELDIELAPVTLLFGTNSSGKSSVLQALLMLKQTVNHFDRKLVLNFGGSDRDYVDLGSYQDVVYGHDEEKGLGIEISWETKLRSIRQSDQQIVETGSMINSYTAEWGNLREQVFIRQLIFLEGGNKTEIKRVSPEYDPEVVELPFHFMGSEIEKITLGGSYEVNILLKNSMVYSVGNIFVDFISQISYLGPLRTYLKRLYVWTGAIPRELSWRGEQSVEMIIASTYFHDSQLNRLQFNVTEWLIKLGLIDNLGIKRIKEDQHYYEPRITIAGKDSSIIDVGFGVSQVLPVLVMLFSAPEGSIVLLEQPELHLHPSAQAVLADLFLHVAETRKLQLIVESHSEHLLTRMQRRIAESENGFATPENIRAYFCQKGENGAVLNPVEVNPYGQILNYPDNFFGDRGGDIEQMSRAGLAKRRKELEAGD